MNTDDKDLPLDDFLGLLGFIQLGALATQS